VNGFAHLLSSLQVGRMTVANRIVMAPMERNFGNPDGTVSRRTLAHYEAVARGGVGWIDVESTFVDPAGRGRTHQLGLHDDACVEGFAALAELAHANGARIGVELHHAGRNTSRAISGHEPVAPSPVPCPEAGPDTPRELTVGEIDAVVDRYAAAARRAAEAGFDAVELHSAHGYLPLAFLSPLTNLRTDDYGGPLENRMRFALRVIEAFRGAVPEHVTIGCRFSAEERLPGGLTVDDTVPYAQALEAAGVDYLHVSAGVYASFRWIIPAMDIEPGWLLPVAAQIKSAVGIPVVGVSRVNDPALAERAIADGMVDLVAFGRAFLTDPEFPAKLASGRHDEIVTCIGCNEGCTRRIANQRDVTCLVNPRAGRELELLLDRAAAPRRVVVIGGGPAGMEAARVASERGHDVRLIESGSELGGQARLAAALPHREGWRTFCDQGRRRLERAGVRLELGRRVGPDEFDGIEADAVVLATGAEFLREEIPGGDATTVVDAATLLAGPADRRPAHAVVIAGPDPLGLNLAEWLAAGGSRVSVVTRVPVPVDPETQPGLLERIAGTPGIALFPDRRVAELGSGGVRLVRSGAIGSLFEQEIRDVDLVVLADRRRSSSGLAWYARNTTNTADIYEIGDCRQPRTAVEAVYEGAIVGRRIS
jgi:2,4-dienoyl-CoA reductase-like NADH-dependent reductase (Old Yellow Enzyme family)/thioredoxin reductase